MTYRKILGAIDCDDAKGARLIVARCASLARLSEAKVSLVHVRLSVPRSYTRHLPENWEIEQAQQVKSQLRDLAREHALEANLSSVHAPAGSITREVIRKAEEERADVIVVAAHHMTLGRIILGSNSHAIMRDAECDVLVVRDRWKAE